MDWSVQKKLFIGFFRAGMIGYRSGPASIPLVHKEIVAANNWISDEEFYDILAIKTKSIPLLLFSLRLSMG